MKKSLNFTVEEFYCHKLNYGVSMFSERRSFIFKAFQRKQDKKEEKKEAIRFSYAISTKTT